VVPSGTTQGWVRSPSKALQNSKCNGLFIESFKGQKLLNNKVQWLDLASCLWPTLVELPLVRTINVHYEIIVMYSKPHLTSSSLNYSWFMQYMKNDNGKSGIIQLPKISMNFFDTSANLIYCVFVVGPSIIFTYLIIKFCLQLVQIIVCRLQVMFGALKGRK
jgi:hypothetical protein